MKKQRLKPAERQLEILRAAIPLAEEYGYDRVTQTQVAEAAGVTGPLLVYHFRTMEVFRKALLDYAIENAVLKVVAQAALKGEDLPANLRRRAMDSLR